MDPDKEKLTFNKNDNNDKHNVLSTIVQKIEVSPYNEDIGLNYCWLIVAIGSIVQFFILGTMNNIGSISVKWEDEFKASTSSVAFIGSLNYGLMFILGPVVTKMCEIIGAKWVMFIGALLSALGIFMTSFVHNILLIYFSYGVLFGIGGSMCYFPSVIVLPQFFTKKLSIVNGLVSAGSGAGTMAMSRLFPLIYEKYGWRKAYLIIAAIMVCVSLITLLYGEKKASRLSCKKMKCTFIKTSEYKAFFDFSVLKNIGYCLFVACCCMFMLGYFVPFVHLTNFSMMNNVEYSQASMLVGYMSISSLCGRLIFGFCADSPMINRLLVFQIALLMTGLANVYVMMAKSLAWFIVYAVWFGFFEGCYVCLCAVIVGDVVGLDLTGSGIGLLYGLKAAPLMIGPPFAGFVKDYSNSFQIPFLISGIFSALSAMLMFLVSFTVPSTVNASFITQKSETTKCKKHMKKDGVHSAPRLIMSDSANSLLNEDDIPDIKVIDENENLQYHTNKDNTELLLKSDALTKNIVISKSMNFNQFFYLDNNKSLTRYSLKSLQSTNFDLVKKVSLDDLKGLQFQIIPSILPKVDNFVPKAKSTDFNV